MELWSTECCTELHHAVLPCSCWAVAVPCCELHGRRANASRSHPRRSIAPRAIARTVAHTRMGTVGCRVDRDQPHAAVQLERGAAQAFRGALAPEGTACPNKQRAAAGSAAALTELTELRESSHGHSPCTQRRARRNALRRIRLRRAAQPFCSSLPVPIHRLRSSRAKPSRGRTINRSYLLAVVGAGCAGHCAPQRPQGAAVRLVPRRRAGADLVPARALSVMLSAARSLSRGGVRSGRCTSGSSDLWTASERGAVRTCRIHDAARPCGD
jgi:hypothetical protein